MKELDRIIYKCDFCGMESENKNFIENHEKVCFKNPENQPCSTCNNMILGFRCCKRVNVETIKDNVICFYYKEGMPQENPFTQIFPINGGNK